MKISSITKNGNGLTIELEGIAKPMVCNLAHIPNKERLIQLIKDYAAYQTSKQEIADETDAKYNEWVKNMVGDTVA